MIEAALVGRLGIFDFLKASVSVGSAPCRLVATSDQRIQGHVFKVATTWFSFLKDS